MGLNLTDLFVAFQIAASGANPAPVEDVYSYRESEGQLIYYAAADKEFGIDSANPTKIDANAKVVWFEVSVNKNPSMVTVARAEIEEFRDADGDTFAMLESFIKDKTPEEAMQLYYYPRGRSDVFLPIEFDQNSGSWADIAKYPSADGAEIIFTYNEIHGPWVKRVVAASTSGEYSIGDVYKRWKALVEEYQDINIK